MPKGSTYERELKKDLESKDWYVIRSAGSFATDLVALKQYTNPIGLEIKSCKKKTYYLTTRAKEQLKELKKLVKFGVEPIFAVRFKDYHRTWVFLEARSVKTKVCSKDISDFNPFKSK